MRVYTTDFFCIIFISYYWSGSKPPTDHEQNNVSWFLETSTALCFRRFSLTLLDLSPTYVLTLLFFSLEHAFDWRILAKLLSYILTLICMFSATKKTLACSKLTRKKKKKQKKQKEMQEAASLSLSHTDTRKRNSCKTGDFLWTKQKKAKKR